VKNAHLELQLFVDMILSNEVARHFGVDSV